MQILVVDIGGSHIKCTATSHPRTVRLPSGPTLTPTEMVEQVLLAVEGWRFDVISIGYPGVVRDGVIAVEPHNLGPGWVGYDLSQAFGRPVRLINDAAMQALGGYEGGTMLFLGLGTGLGSALIAQETVIPLELSHLRRTKRHDYEYYLGDRGRRRLGDKKWRATVTEVVEEFRRALLPGDILLGGGNAARLKRLPPGTRRGTNADAFTGGCRLWERSRRRNQ